MCCHQKEKGDVFKWIQLKSVGFDSYDFSSSYHFATIGVGMPLMFAIAEFLGIRKNDLQYIAMAKRWAKAYTITVAVELLQVQL